MSIDHSAHLDGMADSAEPILPVPPPGCTPWFAGAVQPVQPGVYLRKYRAGLLYCLWDDHWFPGECTPAEAVESAKLGLAQHQSLPWCGLMSPPPQGYGTRPLPGARTC